MDEERKPARAWRSRRLVWLAALGGGLAGLGAVYGIGAVGGNQVAACPAERPVNASLQPLARGELAAVVVRERPAPLPNLGFTDAEGRARSLEQFRGKTVLLNLWAVWCAPCREEMPALDRLQAALGGEGFQVVPISIDRDAAVAAKFLKETGIANLPLYTNTSAQVFQDLKASGKAFGMPTTLLIGPDGCELANLAGPAKWDSADGQALIRAALGR